jgi:hypothetical protein
MLPSGDEVMPVNSLFAFGRLPAGCQVAARNLRVAKPWMNRNNCVAILVYVHPIASLQSAKSHDDNVIFAGPVLAILCAHQTLVLLELVFHSITSHESLGRALRACTTQRWRRRRMDTINPDRHWLRWSIRGPP